MEPEKLEFDLLTNGLDFILESIHSIINFKKEKKHIKYAILNLSAGVDLVFKERLSKEHWSFIFENIDKADKSKILDGDFISVNSNTCIKRLQNNCSIEFSSRDLQIIENLRRRRNKIEHFVINENIESLKSILSKVLSVLIFFIEKELDVNKFSEEQLDYYKKIRIKSSKFENFVNLKMAQLKGNLNAEPWLIRCPECLQTTLSYNNKEDLLSCYFCNQEDEMIKIANCSECSNKSLMLNGWTLEIRCFTCGYMG